MTADAAGEARSVRERVTRPLQGEPQPNRGLNSAPIQRCRGHRNESVQMRPLHESQPSRLPRRPFSVLISPEYHQHSRAWNWSRNLERASAGVKGKRAPDMGQRRLQRLASQNNRQHAAKVSPETGAGR